MVLEDIQRGTWKCQLRELKDALGDNDLVNLEMNLEVENESVWRCTWIL